MNEYLKLRTEVEQQEQALQFDRFTHEDAWRLGNLFYDVCKAEKLDVCIDIRLSDTRMFHYAFPGGCANRDTWLDAKYRTVRDTHHASLRLFYHLRANDRAPESYYLPASAYAVYGGGFPLAIKNVGVVGYIGVSGLDHVDDHNLIVRVVSQYLGVTL